MENLDWESLPFGYIKTDFNIRCVYKDGKWGKLEVSSSEYIDIHIAATGLHYGQEAFEGLKAYMGKDGKIRLFRWEENAKRMIASANGIKMEAVPVEMFHDALFKVIQLNKKFVPPYGSGATLYIRPLLYGSGAEVGVKPASEYTFLVFVTTGRSLFQGRNKACKYADMQGCRQSCPFGNRHLQSRWQLCCKYESNNSCT